MANKNTGGPGSTIKINIDSKLDSKGFEDASVSADKLGKSIDGAARHGAKGFSNMGMAVLNASYFIDDMQYGVRGVLNNISPLIFSIGGGAGLAGAISIAAVAASQLWEKLGNSQSAKKAIEEEKEALTELIDLSASVKKEQASLQNEAAGNFYGNISDDVLQKYQSITGELKRQLDLTQRRIDLEKGFSDDESEIKRQQVEKDFYDGKITQREKDIRLAQIEMDANKKRRDFEEQSAKAVAETAQKQRNEAEKTFNTSVGSLDAFTDERILGQGETSRITKNIQSRENQISDFRDRLEQEYIEKERKKLERAQEIRESFSFYTPEFIKEEQQKIEDSFLETRGKIFDIVSGLEDQNIQDQNKLSKSNEALSALGYKPGEKVEDQETTIRAYNADRSKLEQNAQTARKNADQADLEAIDARTRLENIQDANQSKQKVDVARRDTTDARVRADERKEAQENQREALENEIKERKEGEKVLAEENKRIADSIRKQEGQIRKRAEGMDDKTHEQVDSVLNSIDEAMNDQRIDSGEKDALAALKQKIAQKSRSKPDPVWGQLISLVNQTINGYGENSQLISAQQKEITELSNKFNALKRSQAGAREAQNNGRRYTP